MVSLNKGRRRSRILSHFDIIGKKRLRNDDKAALAIPEDLKIISLFV
jgi:hypothetical protein